MIEVNRLYVSKSHYDSVLVALSIVENAVCRMLDGSSVNVDQFNEYSLTNKKIVHNKDLKLGGLWLSPSTQSLYRYEEPYFESEWHIKMTEVALDQNHCVEDVHKKGTVMTRALHVQRTWVQLADADDDSKIDFINLYKTPGIHSPNSQRHEYYEQRANMLEAQNRLFDAKSYRNSAIAAMKTDMAWDAEAMAISKGRFIDKMAFTKLSAADQTAMKLKGLKEFNVMNHRYLWYWNA